MVYINKFVKYTRNNEQGTRIHAQPDAPPPRGLSPTPRLATKLPHCAGDAFARAQGRADFKATSLPIAVHEPFGRSPITIGAPFWR